ncbi:hypothetical protein [Flavobacterium sp.]|jgi:hypothetical protein|uniref:hypothetical protein n=1 Tax=Flavobacterium sp. TaxID=239 RepID=UPI0037C033FA
MPDVINRIWIVGGNLVLIKKHPEIHTKYTWYQMHKDRNPNLVCVRFNEKHPAKELYNLLREAQLPATKNWVN